VWTGQQALEHGLIDELGGLDSAITYAAETANLDAYGIQRIPERRSFIEQLVEQLSDPSPDAHAALSQLPLQGAALRTAASISRLERVLADGSPTALLPGDLSLEDPHAPIRVSR
jgi:ClpP class serine protease